MNNMDGAVKDNEEGVWCTLQEYRQISAWAKNITQRWLRQMAREEILPVQTRRAYYYSGRKPIYLVMITDLAETEKLLGYRKNKAIHQAVMRIKAKNTDPIQPHASQTDSLSRDTTTDSHKHFTVRMPMNYQLCLQNIHFRKSIIKYLETNRGGGRPAGNTHRVGLLLSKTAHAVLRHRAKTFGCSMNTAFLFAFEEYMQTAEGKLATITATYAKRLKDETVQHQDN